MMIKTETFRTWSRDIQIKAFLFPMTPAEAQKAGVISDDGGAFMILAEADGIRIPEQAIKSADEPRALRVVFDRLGGEMILRNADFLRIVAAQVRDVTAIREFFMGRKD